MRPITQLCIRHVLSLLTVCFASISLVDVALAEFWYEDFTDGNLSDSGIDWTFTSREISSDSLELFPGGKGANQGVAAARLGAEVAIVGAVGGDQAGQPT